MFSLFVNRVTSDELLKRACRVQKGKELNDFQRIPLDIEILSNLRFGSLEIRDTSVTRVTNNNSSLVTLLTNRETLRNERYSGNQSQQTSLGRGLSEFLY